MKCKHGFKIESGVTITAQWRDWKEKFFPRGNNEFSIAHTKEINGKLVWHWWLMTNEGNWSMTKLVG